MKKYRGFLLMICLALSVGAGLWGCDSRKDGQGEGQLPELLIGIDGSYEPYSYVDENGNFAGLDVELAREACSRMGREPVFVSIKWDNKDAYLEDGTIDCIWSCFSMTGREEDYDWVGPYMYSRQVVAVRSDSTITSLSDLTGKTVAVMSSTKPESIFLEEGEGIPQVKQVYCLENMDLVFSALKSGYVDAAAGHEIVMGQYMETVPGQYRLLEDALQSVKVGVAFQKGSEEQVREELNQALASMKEDGTLEAMLSAYEISGEDAMEGESE